MSTVNESIARDVIAKHGRYEGDPQVTDVIVYFNLFNGKIAWKLVYEGEDPIKTCQMIAGWDAEIVWNYKTGWFNKDYELQIG